MRIGENPEKNRLTKILYKKHRVIIPVYIPDDEETYFNELFSVFKESINSLLKTTSSKNTLITIINNNCKEEVTIFIDKLLSNKKIDKHVKLSVNYGKVYTILSEARASYEDYITIADADVFYFSNWESEVFNVFKAFGKAGVVAPLPAPQGALHNNVSLFGNFFNKPKRANVVDTNSFELFEKGTNNPKIFNNKMYKWKEKQYFLEKDGVKACVGSGHFIATYKNVFKYFPSKKPKFVFRQGDEDEFLDSQFDKLGYYRLSTVKAYAYHLGNTIPNWVKEYKFKKENLNSLRPNALKNNNSSKLKYLIKKFVFKLLKKFKMI